MSRILSYKQTTPKSHKHEDVCSLTQSPFFKKCYYHFRQIRSSKAMSVFEANKLRFFFQFFVSFEEVLLPLGSWWSRRMLLLHQVIKATLFPFHTFKPTQEQQHRANLSAWRHLHHHDDANYLLSQSEQRWLIDNESSLTLTSYQTFTSAGASPCQQLCEIHHTVEKEVAYQKMRADFRRLSKLK